MLYLDGPLFIPGDFMKYFKHLVDSGDDPDIGEAMERFGNLGYFVFFRTLEIMAREFNISNPGENTFNFLWFFRRFLGLLSKNKLKEILDYFDKKGRIYVKIDGSYITLNCPKLRGLSDEYTQKVSRQRSGVTPDSVRTNSGKCPLQNKNKNKNKEDKNIKRVYTLKILGILQKPNNGFCTLCLTLLLMDGIKTFDSGAKVPTYGSALFLKWLDEIRKMRELDKRSRPFIYDLIIFSQESEFWRSNILSTHKLRDKSTALLHQSKKYYEAKRERRVGEHKRRQ